MGGFFDFRNVSNVDVVNSHVDRVFLKKRSSCELVNCSIGYVSATDSSNCSIRDCIIQEKWGIACINGIFDIQNSIICDITGENVIVCVAGRIEMSNCTVSGNTVIDRLNSATAHLLNSIDCTKLSLVIHWVQ